MNVVSRIVCAIALVSVISIAGCGPFSSQYSDADSGKTVTVHVGDTFTVQLANPSGDGGWTWTSMAGGGSIVSISAPTPQSAGPFAGTGAFGPIDWQATALHIGTTTLRTEYRRFGVQAATKVWTLIVKVTA